MDYLSRILLALPQRDEAGVLPHLTEAAFSAASAQEAASGQVSPAETAMASAVEKLAEAFSLAEARSRHMHGTARPGAEKNRKPVPAPETTREGRTSVYGASSAGELLRETAAVSDAEALSHIFRRDARRYG